MISNSCVVVVVVAVEGNTAFDYLQEVVLEGLSWNWSRDRDCFWKSIVVAVKLQLWPLLLLLLLLWWWLWWQICYPARACLFEFPATGK